MKVKKQYIYIMLLLSVPILVLAADRWNIIFDSGTVTMNTTVLDGTNLRCSDIVEADLGTGTDFCTGASSGSNASINWNANYTNMLTDCSGSDVSFGMHPNGTWKCVAQSGGGSGNSSQDINNAEIDPIFSTSITQYWNMTNENVGWKNLTDYPTACTAAQYISAFGDTLSCALINIAASQVTSGTFDTARIPQAFNETALIQAVNTTANIEALGFVTGAHTGGDGNATYSTFFANTTVLYTGNLTNGSLTGYFAANSICNITYTDTHLCSFQEIQNTYSQDTPTWSGTFWIATGGAKYSPADVPVNDCNGFKHGVPGSYLGSFWITDDDKGGVGHCGNTFPIACCK